MRRNAPLAAILGWLAAAGWAGGQTGSPGGAEYWLAFQPNLDAPEASPELSLVISAESDATVSWEAPTGAPAETREIAAGEAIQVPLPSSLVLESSDDVEAGSVRVSAAGDVTVFALSRISGSADGYLALAADGLGTDYRVLAYPGARPGDSRFSSQFAVVATRDATVVTITPSVATDGHAAGVSYTVRLDRGGTYQLRNDEEGADLTGTAVTATAPIAVFAGHQCAFVPSGFQSCDHLVEQMPPVDAWGTRYFTAPLATRLGDAVRILAGDEETLVTVDSARLFLLEPREVLELILDEAAEITADRPILVAQLATGAQFDGVVEADPFMTLVPPVEQYRERYTFATPGGFADHFLSLVVPEAAVDSVDMDGEALSARLFAPIGESGFWGGRVEVEPGFHRLDAGLPFAAVVYGFDGFTSYGHLVGQGGLRDGGFEALFRVATVVLENPYWKGFSGNFRTPFCTVEACGTGRGTAGPRSGGGWVWLGGYPGAEAASVEQRVVIPEGDPFLRFRLWNGASGREQDRFVLSVDDTRLLEVASGDERYLDDYAEVVADLAAWADGKAHRLLFELEPEEGGRRRVTTFSVDDVALTMDATAPSTACELYPIALHESSVDDRDVGDEIPDILNGSEAGNFGWLTWSGNLANPALVASLTPPGDSASYGISEGDLIAGRPGVANSRPVRAALEGLVGRAQGIVVPVWDFVTPDAGGANVDFHISGFVRVRITGFDLPRNRNRISALFLGEVTCPGERESPGAPASRRP